MKSTLMRNVLLLAGIAGTASGQAQTTVTSCGNTVLTVPAAFLGNSYTGDGNFNAIIFGSDSASGGDIEGRAVIGANMTIAAGFSVGQGGSGSSRLTPANFDNLIVNGNYASLTPFDVRGNFVYNALGSGAALPTVASGAIYGPGITGRIDFTAARSYYQGLSTRLAALAATGTTTYTTSGYQTITFTGSDSTLNIFDADLSVFTNLQGIEINVPIGSSVVINVSAAAVSINGGSMVVNSTNISGASTIGLTSRMLWNFTNTVSINLASYEWGGSVLAPYARLAGYNGSICGQAVIGGDVIQNSGFEFHNYCYEGVIPTSSNSAVFGER